MVSNLLKEERPAQQPDEATETEQLKKQAAKKLQNMFSVSVLTFL